MSALFDLCATLTMDTSAFESAAQSALQTGESLSAGLEKQLSQAGQNLQSAAEGASSAWNTLGQTGSASMANLRQSGVSAWRAIESQITSATAAARRYLSLQGGGKGYAVGLDYVPYNEFPATLHEGEAVLTKAEANAWRKGESTAASSGASAKEIAEAVQSALSSVTVRMDGETVGRLVADTVSREIGRKGRERSTR